MVLLADSRPLFSTTRAGALAPALAAMLEAGTPRAAYLGASNGDLPDFYQIFESAMDLAGIRLRRMIPAQPSPADRAWLGDADLILLAGGDVARGWHAFVNSGLDTAIIQRHRAGALLVGVSAGAIQLGLGLWQAAGNRSIEYPSDWPTDPARELQVDGSLLTTFGFSHHLLAAHDEERNWSELRRGVPALGGTVAGYGLPSGGGLFHHADGSLEPIDRPVLELRWKNNQLVERLLQPGRRDR